MDVILCITFNCFVDLINKYYPIIASLGILFIVGMLFYALFLEKEKKFTIGIRKEIVIWVTMVCSFIALCRTFPSDFGLDFDYIGIIVAIFSALITTLIGWNIFTALDLKKDIKEHIEKSNKRIHEIEGELHKEVNKINSERIELKNNVNDEIKKIRIDFLNRYIREETSLISTYYQNGFWSEIVPIANQMTDQYRELLELKKEDVKVEGFVNCVAQLVNEIVLDDEYIRSDMSLLMPNFKRVFTGKDDRVEKICELYEQKKKDFAKIPKPVKSQYFSCNIKYAVKQKKDGVVNYICDGYDSRFQFSFKNCKLNEAHLFSTPNAAMAAYRDRADNVSADEAANSRPIIISVIESKKEQ